MTRRSHYYLWLGPNRLPVCCSADAWWQPTRIVRPMPRRAQGEKRAAA